MNCVIRIRFSLRGSHVGDRSTVPGVWFPVYFVDELRGAENAGHEIAKHEIVI